MPEYITLVSGCRNLVLASPHTNSGETAAYATWVVSKRASSVGFCWLAPINFEPGSGPPKPTNASVVGTRFCLKEMCDVASLESDQERNCKWLDRNIHDFVMQENKNSYLLKEE